MPIKTHIKQASGWFYFNSPRGRAELRGAGVILMLHRVLADDASTRCSMRITPAPRSSARPRGELK